MIDKYIPFKSELVNIEINNIVNEWLIWMRYEKSYSINTFESYINDLITFFEFLNHYNNNVPTLEYLTNDVDHIVLRSWLSDLKTNKKLSAKTISRAKSSVMNFYNYLAKNYNFTKISSC